MNIVSVLIRALPQRQREVEERLTQLPGVELHVSTGDGRFIVTVEGERRRDVGDVVIKLHGLEGVLTAAMVYEYTENNPSSVEATQ